MIKYYKVTHFALVTRVHVTLYRVDRLEPFPDASFSTYCTTGPFSLMASVTQLALPGVVLLILFLAYGSQILLSFTEPGPLEQKQTFIFNAFVGCIWLCYGRACFTDPGRVPSDWTSSQSKVQVSASPKLPIEKRQRWCRRCEAFKPPRAHHCKVCQR